jgi:hypothetical protein
MKLIITVKEANELGVLEKVIEAQNDKQARIYKKPFWLNTPAKEFTLSLEKALEIGLVGKAALSGQQGERL